ncbi:mitochondrial ribosome-associated GTPase 2 isoform X4 [Rhinatrema bivittatum]|uniref:mitochondrial ribosome-associated GTPase 2 isoform X4 n=1 Tax=Rhinatrema bivittatum TaxID=194408 RepID=UPI00112A144D|nr:mitochondrial ribosome-associated GTPase 2 isoform X4 [Rhinatrema bivittatum]
MVGALGLGLARLVLPPVLFYFFKVTLRLSPASTWHVAVQATCVCIISADMCAAAASSTLQDVLHELCNLGQPKTTRKEEKPLRKETVDGQVKSLSLVQPVYRGIDGVPGSSKNCFGCNGENLYIKVPLGTLVKENGNVVADLSQPGDEYVAALGGDGGKGNRFFLTNENRAPVTATMGQEGQERTLQLELKTMAHAGMVGFPNAGKSSLLRTISNARPAVASYPFTTLNPHVGIIQYQDYEQLAVADIPGIIQGAHQNRGLGFAFLRHIERCRFLLYVLDLSAAEPWTQFQDLKYELEAYEEGLSRRPCLIVGNKIDLLQSRVNLPLLRERVGEKVIAVSALTGHNVEELILYLRELYDSCIDTDLSKLQKPLRW